MLETVRAYTVERLGASGSAEELCHQHAEHYAAFAEAADAQLFYIAPLAWLSG
jgi:hypothetical protein